MNNKSNKKIRNGSKMGRIDFNDIPQFTPMENVSQIMVED
jgi:hypothetical protein